MMVLPVTWATASMTCPISTSRKLGVMRCPFMAVCCAPTRPVAVNATNVSSRLARKESLVIALSTLLFVPGSRFCGCLVDRDVAVAAARADLFGFGGDLRDVEYQVLLSAVPGHRDAGVRGGAERVE